jgi:hypothetical protein
MAHVKPFPALTLMALCSGANAIDDIILVGVLADIARDVFVAVNSCESTGAGDRMTHANILKMVSSVVKRVIRDISSSICSAARIIFQLKECRFAIAYREP